VQVDQRGALTVVPHPDYEFLGVRARIGLELVAGVPQVVNVDALQTDSSERRTPDLWRKPASQPDLCNLVVNRFTA
jgi:hypothetical protein